MVYKNSNTKKIEKLNKISKFLNIIEIKGGENRENL